MSDTTQINVLDHYDTLPFDILKKLADSWLPKENEGVNPAKAKCRQELLDTLENLGTIGLVTMLDAFARACHKNAKNKGFWDEEDEIINSQSDWGMRDDTLKFILDAIDAQKIALDHEEISEALSGLRHGNGPSDHIPKFNCAEEEYADCIIRIFDHAVRRKWRVPLALVAKFKFNLSRPPKHGKAF